MPMPPPPPPMGGFKLDIAKPPSIAGGGDPRSALLSSIQKGAKLKKVTTNDKSGVVGAGQVTGATASGSNAASSSVGGGGGPSRPPPPKQISSDAPKLSGLFEGIFEKNFGYFIRKKFHRIFFRL